MGVITYLDPCDMYDKTCPKQQVPHNLVHFNSLDLKSQKKLSSSSFPCWWRRESNFWGGFVKNKIQFFIPTLRSGWHFAKETQ